MIRYEVVCTENYLDVGLLIEKDNQSKPKRVLARASTNNSDNEYGGVEILTWIHTGIYLSRDEWQDISYNESTDQILNELGIKKKINLKEDDYMATDEMAIALVKLYAEYMHTNNGNHYENYAEAVAIAIRMLTD